MDIDLFDVFEYFIASLRLTNLSNTTFDPSNNMPRGNKSQESSRLTEHTSNRTLHI